MKAASPRLTHAQSAHRRRMIADAIKHGMPVHDACDEWQVSYATATMACREHGVEYPRKSAGRPATASTVLQAIAALQNTDDNQTVIGRNLGVNSQRIHQILVAAKEAGIRFPGRVKA